MVNRVNCIKANIAENFLQTSLQQYATLLNSLILYTDQHGHDQVGNVYFGVLLDNNIKEIALEEEMDRAFFKAAF